MHTLFDGSFFSKKSTFHRLFFGTLLLALLICARWLWIDCDGGTPSLLEYGYFATDEGYYAAGGKQKLLMGRFISLIRANPNTYAICPSSHVLTWLSFLIFGQTTWAHRVFPLLINTASWLALYAFLSRRTLAWIAFTLCAVCVLNPFLLVYSRTVCNDTLMASVLLLGYVVARKKGWVPALLGGCVFGLGLWVKQSIWVLALFGLSGAAMAPDKKSRWRRMACFAAGFAVSCALQYVLIRLLIHPDAVAQEATIDELLAASNSSYGLPNPFDLVHTLKGISSFPRVPTGGLLSMWIPLVIVFPALLLVRRLTDLPVRWDGRMLLYAVFPLYALAIMIMDVYYAHYFIPIIAFFPVLWLVARRDLKRWSGHDRWHALLLTAVTGLFVFVSFHTFDVAEAQAESLNAYLANAYNLPQKIVWTRNGGYILAGAAFITAMALWARGERPRCWTVLGLVLSALGVAELCYSRLPLSEAYKYTSLFPSTMKDVAYVLQAGSVVLFFAVWCMPGLVRKGARWTLFLVALMLFATVANPRWRKGVPELTERGHLHKRAVADLSRIVPEDAVVFGERAPQLFLSLKARVSPVPNADPVPTVLKIHEQFPERPLFALIDAEHNYHFTHYNDNKDKIRMQVIHTLKLPSFNTGLPCDVFLVRLTVLDKPLRMGPLKNR